MKAGERDALIERIEDFLVFMELADTDVRRLRGPAASMHFPLSVLRRAEPFGVWSESAGLSEAGDSRLYYSDEQNPARGPSAIDVTFLVDAQLPGGRFCVRRLRTMRPEEKRGRIYPWTPFAVEDHAATLMQDGTYDALHTIWGYVGGSWRRVKVYGADWCPVDPQRERHPLHPVGIAYQHAFYRQMLWHVAIGYGGHSASLLIPVEAAAVLDLFRYRDLPAGKGRRDALLHWVSAHWRRKISDPLDASRVHAHLRGQTTFVWREGLQVQILPAADDKKKVQATHKGRQLAVATADGLA